MDPGPQGGYADPYGLQFSLLPDDMYADLMQCPPSQQQQYPQQQHYLVQGDIIEQNVRKQSCASTDMHLSSTAQFHLSDTLSVPQS
jgi:hypothetical protein